MWRSQRKPSGIITPGTSADRVGVRLVNGVRGQWVTILATATVQVSVAAATALRNRGSIFGAVDEIILDENGTDRHIYKGSVLRFLAEMNARSALSASRAGTAVGTYLLEEAARVWFAWPESVIPGETDFVERDPRQTLNLQVRMAPNIAAALYNVGPATVAVSNVKFEITHGYELPMQGQGAPLFLPTARQQIVQVNGAVTQQAEYLRSPHLVRAIVVSQEVAGVGEVGDILTGLTLRGDFVTPIGPGVESYASLALEQEFEFGGAVLSSNRAHLGFNFQKFGKLAHCLNPAGDTNFRFEFAGAPSATAGQSQLRITILELQRIAGVTAAEIPFPY